MDESNFYVSVTNAEQDCKKRWENILLRTEVERYLGEVPDIFTKGPRASFLRPVVSPNRELFDFINQAEKTNLPIALGEFTKDIFVANNQDKYYLGMLYFYNKKGRNGGDRVKSKRIISFNDSYGKCFSDIFTTWGEEFVGFHHDIFQELLPEKYEKYRFDISDWLFSHGKKAVDFYEYYLGLFLVHGIMFESYLLNDEKEKEFVYEVVFPAYERLQKRFGINPLITPIFPLHENEGIDTKWMYYPEIVSNIVSKKSIVQEGVL